MSRYFEKISFTQFRKDISSNRDLYLDYRMPSRQTKYAAGYDFYAIYDFSLEPGEIKKIPTGIKVCMEDDEVLLLIERSSMGIKYNIRLTNQVGVVDRDYYNNDSNEGHLWICLQNEGSDTYTVHRGDAFCQGIFVKYLTVDKEDNGFIDRVSTY